jgi:rubredoxin
MDPKIPRKKDTIKNIKTKCLNPPNDNCIDCNSNENINSKNISFLDVENDSHLDNFESQKSAEKRYINEFNCDICNFITNRKQNYDKHLLTKKHLLNSHDFIKPNKQFNCNVCNLIFNKNIDLVRHCESKKHLINSGKIKIENSFHCKLCSLNFDKKSAYNKHILCKSHIFNEKNKTNEYGDTCPKNEQNTLTIKNNENKDSTTGATDYIEIINKLLTENQDLRNFLIDQSKEQNEIMNKLVEITKTTSITNATMTNNINGNLINNNQKFNINVFLNEQCKDAINLPEFIENIEVSHEDLENNAQLGFVNGISKIILDNLKQLSIYERPIHCTDLKRETVYVRCHDKWTKEDSADKLSTAIRDISYKSIGVLNEWKQSNPDYQDINSEFSDKCIVMSKNTLAGYDRDTYYPKVIRIISKETVIDRNSIEN